MTRLLYFLAFVFISFCSLIYFLKPLDSGSMHQFGDISAVVASLYALFLMAYALTTFSEKDRQRPGWILLIIGIGLYFLGEASWGYIELIRGIEVPFPSIADLFWLTGYVPLFAGLILIYKRMEVKLARYEKAVFVVLGLLLALIPFWFLLFPIIKSGEASVTEKLLDLAYPGLDIFLALPALAIVLIYGRGLLGRTWLFISLGFLLFTVADLLFSYLTWIEKFKTGSLVDLLWLSGYVMIAVGAIGQIDLVRKARLIGAGAR